MSYECYCDYESPEFYKESRPVAKKLHQCCECRRAIQPGTTYRNVSGKWDGQMCVYKRCAECDGLVRWIKAHVPCFCDMFEGLYEQAAELVSEYPALWFGVKRRELRARQQPKYQASKA